MDRNAFARRAREIAHRLGAQDGRSHVKQIGCEDIALMGDYERSHFHLADFAEDFSMRLNASLERVAPTDRRFRDNVKEECWNAWVTARNREVRRLCPHAREAGED